MRFSPRKTHAIAQRIVDTLRDDGSARLLAPENEIELAIAGAISADLKEEDEIDEEVEQVMEQYRYQIENQAMDATLLQRKIKQEIARKRGFKL